MHNFIYYSDIILPMENFDRVDVMFEGYERCMSLALIERQIMQNISFVVVYNASGKSIYFFYY